MRRKEQAVNSGTTANWKKLREYLAQFFVNRKSVAAQDTERNPASAGNFVYEGLIIRAVKDSDMGDNFGVSLAGQIEDDAGVENQIGVLQFYRNGADNTGRMRVRVYNAGSAVSAMSWLNDGGTILENCKSGATQVGAGAAAGEIWKTASHATLPDNVLMIGV